MDGQISISRQELYAAIGTASAPVLIDVRRDDAFAADDRMLVSARHRPPEHVGKWAHDLTDSRPVVVYCVRGHEVSQQAAAALRAAGFDARSRCDCFQLLERIAAAAQRLDLGTRAAAMGGEVLEI